MRKEGSIDQSIPTPCATRTTGRNVPAAHPWRRRNKRVTAPWTCDVRDQAGGPHIRRHPPIGHDSTTTTSAPRACGVRLTQLFDIAARDAGPGLLPKGVGSLDTSQWKEFLERRVRSGSLRTDSSARPLRSLPHAARRRASGDARFGTVVGQSRLTRPAAVACAHSHPAAIWTDTRPIPHHRPSPPGARLASSRPLPSQVRR